MKGNCWDIFLKAQIPENFYRSQSGTLGLKLVSIEYAETYSAHHFETFEEEKFGSHVKGIVGEKRLRLNSTAQSWSLHAGCHVKEEKINK